MWGNQDPLRAEEDMVFICALASIIPHIAVVVAKHFHLWQNASLDIGRDTRVRINVLGVTRFKAKRRALVRVPF